MIVDAYPHVCPERLLDAISERHPGAESAAPRKNSYPSDGERRLRHIDRIGVAQQALDTIRSLGLGPADLGLVPVANQHRIMRL